MLSSITSKICKELRRSLVTVRSGYFPPHGTYTYRMTVAPYSADQLQVKVEAGELVVKGRIQEQVGEDRWTYEFVKRHRLPQDVDLSTVHTKIENGELVVTAKLKDVM